MSWLRRLLIVLVLLLLLIVVAAGVLLATFDPSRYKTTAIEWVQNHYQRTLKIDGAIRLSVLPRLEVQMAQLSLSEPGSEQVFASVAEAALAVELWPLWQRDLVVNRVLARGVQLRLTRNAQGVRNIDDLLGGPADTTAARAPASPTPASGNTPLQFDISRIELTELKLAVQDDMVPLKGELTLHSLVTGRVADRVEAPVTVDLQLALQQPPVQGRFTAQGRLTPQWDTRTVDLSGLQLRYQGDALGARGIEATVQGRMAYDGARGALQAGPLSLALRASLGETRVEDLTLNLDRFEFDPARQALRLAQLQARLRAQQAGRPVSAALAWPELVVQGERLQGSPLSGEFSLGGAQTVSGRLQSAAPTGSFQKVRVPGLSIALKGQAGAQAGDGTLAGDLLLQTGPLAVALESLHLQAQIQQPGLLPLALEATGQAGVQLAGAARQAQWKISGRLNTNQFGTEGRVVLGGAQPQLRLQARFDALDLNKVLAPPAAAPASAPASAAAPAQDLPVDLSPLKGWQAQVSLRAGSLALRQYRVEQAQLEAALDGGVLKLNRLQGQAWSGQIDASGSADANEHRVALRLNATGVNIQAMLKDVAGQDPLEGIGQVTADLQSQGKTVNELRSRLSGRAALQLRDGAIKGVNLARSLRQAKARLAGAADDVLEQARQTEKTDFSALSASFQVADGIARSNDLDAKSPFLRLAGDGQADIGRGRLDYRLRATVANTSKGQEGAELDSLRGVTVPVALSGPFEAIAWKIQWSAIAASLAKSKVADKLRGQEDKLKDKLGAKLGVKPAAGAASAAASPADLAKDKVKNKLKDLLK